MTTLTPTKKQMAKLQVAMTAAHDNWEGSLHSRAFFKTHDSALGDDLVQTTFLKT